MKPFLVVSALTVALLWPGSLAQAMVHDGRSYAIEEAIPKLEQRRNPYILREQWWFGDLEKRGRKVIRHQLYRGNDYWFWVGASEPSDRLSVHIYDPQGRLVDAESYRKEQVAAARVEAEVTGSYYVVIQALHVSQSTLGWAMLYGYR
ncbi:MAG: hypothetical protein AAF555_08075 [Verrucomicrobiota bacterium]